MIAFLTSFRARALAREWDRHVLLLNRAIGSMLSQTRGECCAVVACHDLPESRYRDHSRVHFISVDFAPPERNNDDMCVDKVLKLSAGAKWAIDRGCEYIVFSDADDLVSNRIGAYVDDHRGENGWCCSSEIFYTLGGRLARFFRMQAPAAGPCVIVRADLLQFAFPPFAGHWADLIRAGGEDHYLKLLERRAARVNTLAAVGHNHYLTLMKLEGHPLRSLPFPGNVVINHNDSMSFVEGGAGSFQPLSLRTRAKRFLQFLPSMRLMSPSLRSEFSVPSNKEIPRAYRNAGSVFWR
jgi:hypothetical protein